MFEAFLTALKVKEVNILAHDLGLTVALELLARQVFILTLKQKKAIFLIALCCTLTTICPTFKFTPSDMKKERKIS